GLGLDHTLIVGLALDPDRELALRVLIVDVRNGACFGRQKPSEVPARGRKRERLLSAPGMIFREERTNQIGLQRVKERGADFNYTAFGRHGLGAPQSARWRSRWRSDGGLEPPRIIPEREAFGGAPPKRPSERDHSIPRRGIGE